MDASIRLLLGSFGALLFCSLILASSFASAHFSSLQFDSVTFSCLQLVSFFCSLHSLQFGSHRLASVLLSVGLASAWAISVCPIRSLRLIRFGSFLFCSLPFASARFG
jgi:hypothetical protein